jgi:hypothetical protein
MGWVERSEQTLICWWVALRVTHPAIDETDQDGLRLAE